MLFAALLKMSRHTQHRAHSLVESLGLSKLSARWVPKLQRPSQQQTRADLSTEILNKWDEYPEVRLHRMFTRDYGGILLVDFLESKRTINDAYYEDGWRKLALTMRRFLVLRRHELFRWDIFQHTPYNPDLSMSDIFFVFVFCFVSKPGEIERYPPSIS